MCSVLFAIVSSVQCVMFIYVKCAVQCVVCNSVKCAVMEGQPVFGVLCQAETVLDFHIKINHFPGGKGKF